MFFVQLLIRLLSKNIHFYYFLAFLLKGIVRIILNGQWAPVIKMHI